MKIIKTITPLVFVLALSAGASPALGQGQPAREVGGDDSVWIPKTILGGLEPGTRVRVTLPEGYEATDQGWATDGRPIEGEVVLLEDGILTVRPDGEPDTTLPIPVGAIQRLQVSRGRSSNALPGAVVGFFTGLAISIAVQTDNHSDEFLGGLEDMGENITRGIAITTVGTLAGLGIGSSIGEETWERVGLQGMSLGVGFAPMGEVGLVATFSF